MAALLTLERALKASTKTLVNEMEAAGFTQNDLETAVDVLMKRTMPDGQFQISEPCKVVVKKKDDDGGNPMFRHVACIGTEPVKYSATYLGKQRGLVLQVEVELPRKSKTGDEWELAEMADYSSLRNLMRSDNTLLPEIIADMATSDLFAMAEEVHQHREKEERKARAKEIADNKEHYGRSFGQWG